MEKKKKEDRIKISEKKNEKTVPKKIVKKSKKNKSSFLNKKEFFLLIITISMFCISLFILNKYNIKKSKDNANIESLKNKIIMLESQVTSLVNDINSIKENIPAISKNRQDIDNISRDNNNEKFKTKKLDDDFTAMATDIISLKQKITDFENKTLKEASVKKKTESIKVKKISAKDKDGVIEVDKAQYEGRPVYEKQQKKGDKK